VFSLIFLMAAVGLSVIEGYSESVIRGNEARLRRFSIQGEIGR